MIRKRNIAALLLLAVLLATWMAPALATQATQVDMIKAFGKSPLSLEKLRGRAIMVFFFVENSSACREQLAQVKKIHDTYDPLYLQIILSHEWQKETQKNTQKVVAELGLEEMTVFEDKKIKLAKKLKITSAPTTYFIDQQGMLVDAFAHDISYDGMAEVIDYMGVPKRGATPQATAAETATGGATEMPAVTPTPVPAAPPAQDPSGGAPLGSIGVVQ